MKITIFPHILGMVVDLLLAKPANVDLSFENSVERFLRVSYDERTISENYISAITCMLLVRRATKIARKRHDNSNLFNYLAHAPIATKL